MQILYIQPEEPTPKKAKVAAEKPAPPKDVPKEPEGPLKCTCWDEETQVLESSKFRRIEAKAYFTDKYKEDHKHAVSVCAKTDCKKKFTSDMKRAKDSPEEWSYVSAKTPIYCCETADTSENNRCMVAFCEGCYSAKLNVNDITHKNRHEAGRRPKRGSRE